MQPLSLRSSIQHRHPDFLGSLTQSLTSNPVLLATNLGLAAIIFTLDAFVPTGVVDAVLYVVLVAWVGLWSDKHETPLVLVTASGCSILAILGFILDPPGEFWIGVVNRGIAIFLISVTALLSVLRKRAEEETKILRGLLPICSYCKKIRNDRGQWKQLEAYIAEHSEAGFSHSICAECGSRHHPELFVEKQAASKV